MAKSTKTAETGSPQAPSLEVPGLDSFPAYQLAESRLRELMADLARAETDLASEYATLKRKRAAIHEAAERVIADRAALVADEAEETRRVCDMSQMERRVLVLREAVQLQRTAVQKLIGDLSAQVCEGLLPAYRERVATMFAALVSAAHAATDLQLCRENLDQQGFRRLLPDARIPLWGDPRDDQSTLHLLLRELKETNLLTGREPFLEELAGIMYKPR
jgi:hypothetical protein